MAIPTYVGRYHFKPARVETGIDFQVTCMRRDSARNRPGKLQCL